MTVARDRGARFDAVIARAMVADVLRLARVEPPADERRAILCPLHSERTPSFQIQSSGRGYHCHGCNGFGGVLELCVALGLARDRTSAVDLLADSFGIPRNDENAPRRSRRHLQIAPAFIEKPKPPEREMTADDRDALKRAVAGRQLLENTPGADYLASRGICAAAASAQRVRYHENWLGRGPAVVFGIHDRNYHTVATQGRFIEPTTDPKAMTKGPLSLGVFATAAAIEAWMPVAICEAPIDALSLAACELPAIALCGTSNRPAWLRKTLGLRPVIIATDNDVAGDRTAAELVAWLDLGTRCSRLRLPQGVKDANELFRRDPHALLELARSTRFAAMPAIETTSPILRCTSSSA